MEEFSWKAIWRHRKIELMLGVLVVVVCAGIGWIAGNSGQGADTSRAILWTTLFTILGFVLVLITEIIYRVTRMGIRHDVDIIIGHDRLLECFKEMHRTERATLVKAIWSTKYAMADPESYFGEEFKLLRERKSLNIHRLINSTSVGDGKFKDYCDVYNNFLQEESLDVSQRYNHGCTNIDEFECFVVIYHINGVEKVKALLVYNNPLVGSLPMGLYIDSERSVEAREAARTVGSWFDNLVNKSTEFGLITDKKNRITVKENQYQHDSETKIPWDDIASEWDTYVTKSNYPAQVAFMEEEQRLLLSTIKDFTETHPNIVIIDIGSGTGRSLFHIRYEQKIMDATRYLIGIDSTHSMTTIAMTKLQELRDVKELSDSDYKKHIFLTLEAEKLDKFFYDGAAVTSMFGKNRRNRASFALLDPKKYNESLKIVCIMLNTLGNIEPTRRGVVLKVISRAIKSGDKIIVSVYDALAFEKGAPELYSHIGPLVGNYNNEDFNFLTHEFKPQKYYSHWFTRSEIIGLIEAAGFKDIQEQTINNGEIFGFFIEAVKA